MSFSDFPCIFHFWINYYGNPCFVVATITTKGILNVHASLVLALVKITAPLCEGRLMDS